MENFFFGRFGSRCCSLGSDSVALDGICLGANAANFMVVGPCAIGYNTAFVPSIVCPYIGINPKKTSYKSTAKSPNSCFPPLHLTIAESPQSQIMAVYENHQDQLWDMPRAEWDRQASILEYTIRATGQYQYPPGVSATFEPALHLLSPDVDPNEYRRPAESGYFEGGRGGVFHGGPFSMSAGAIPTSSCPSDLQMKMAPLPVLPLTEESQLRSHYSPPSPPSPISSSSEEEYHDTPSSPARRRRSSATTTTTTTLDKTETLKRSHTIVERNYRSRLNAKIEALSHQLFDSPSNQRERHPRIHLC